MASKKELFSIPKRYILAILAHFGFFVVYALRVNLSVALVAMVNTSYAESLSDGPECRTGNKTVNTKNKGEFNWDQNQQGLILSSFFYGYLLTQVPGGWLASRFGGKWVFAVGVLGTSVLTLLTPVAAHLSFYLLIVVRVLEGVGEGVTFPAMHCMMGVWAPPVERSTIFVSAYSGMFTGTILAMPISGILADSSFLGGWPSVFYVFGVLGFVWFVLWSFFISNRPEEHPTISIQEKKFITTSLKTCNRQRPPVPWIDIFKSVPVWACLIAHFCNNWVWYMVLTGLPLYFKQVLDFNLKENGFLSALPFIAAMLCTLVAGILADFLRKNYLSTTTTRKIMSAIGFFPTVLFLILASYTDCDEIALSVVYMTLATGILNFNTAGYNVNMVDISQNFSGIVMGVCNVAGTVAGCITPSITGYFTNRHANRTQYRKVFAIAAAITGFGGLFYIVAGSGERQYWDNVTVDDSHTEVETNEELTDTDDFTDDQKPLIPK